MLTKGFLRNKYLLVYSKSRIIKSALVGLIASLFIYSFLCGLRLLFRSMEFGYSNGPQLIDEASRYWQNFNFALISFVLGNTGFIQTFFKRPSSIRLPNYRRNAILVDQVSLSFNFAHLFFKVFFMLSVMSMMVLDLKLFDVSTYLFLLIAIVLFLESYKTIVKVYRKKAYILMLVNALVIIIGVFSIANTSIFNYKKIDKMLLANNPRVELPASDFSDAKYVFFKLKVFKYDGETVYNINGAKTEMNRVAEFVRAEYYYQHEKPSISLLISKDILMKEVIKLQQYLYYQNLTKITYVVRNPNTKINRFDLRGISRRLPFYEINENDPNRDFYPPPPPPPPSLYNFVKRGVVVDVVISLNNIVIVDGTSVKSINDLIAMFEKKIDKKVIFNFVYDESSTMFQDYINVYSSYRNAIDNLRNSYLRKLGRPFIKEYDNGYHDVMKEVKSKYPMRQIDNYIPDSE